VKIELGEWVSVHGISARVCGVTRDMNMGVTAIDVCFRPHQYHGYHFADHRELKPPFIFVSPLGRLEPKPFEPYGQETKE